jgi:hypothetical protein
MSEITKGAKLKKADPVPEKKVEATSGGGGGGVPKGANPMAAAGGMNLGQLVAMKAQLRKDRSDKLEGLLSDRSTEADLKSKNIVKDGGNMAAAISGLTLKKTSVDLNKKLNERPAADVLVKTNVLKKVDKSALK